MSCLRIAVIGSGISGLSCAWLLSQHHNVTLIEAEGRLGGHAHTVDAGGPEQPPTPVDTGFIVFNAFAYPNFTALLAYLGVASTPTTMSFSVSINRGTYEYSGNSLATLLGRAGQWLQPAQWRMVYDLVRFYRTGSTRMLAYPADTSLGDFLHAERYASRFIDRHILPMAGAIWSSTPAAMMNYPLQAFMRFFANHGLLELGARPLWRTVAGGSRNYVNALRDDGKFRVISGQPVTAVRRLAGQVEITGPGDFTGRFDHVVLATHADQALHLLQDADAREKALLLPFVTQPNRTVLHRDDSLMPKARRFWSAWNYLGMQKPDGQGHVGMCVSYWMNALQKLTTKANYFVTLNPLREPAADKIDGVYNYRHPIFDVATLAVQKNLWDLQGSRNTWFCGAWFGSGFHEDGLQAGLAVAEQLGGVRRPWSVADESARIFVKPRHAAAEDVFNQAAE